MKTSQTTPPSTTKSRSKQLARQRGLKVEQLAACYLQRQGLKLLHNNFHCRRGEIDLIMLDNNSYLVFVEVKYRKQGLEQALESVTATKQQRIISAAAHFLLCHSQYQQHNCRFDIVAVWQESQATKKAYPENKSTITGGKKLCFHWLPNAFTL